MKGMAPMDMAPPHDMPRGGKSPSAAAHDASSSMSSLMRMSFFWGDRAVVLFPGWPGERGAGAYVLCLLFVAALAALAEALAAVSRFVARRAAASASGGEDGRGSAPAPAWSAALLTLAHAARMGTAYLVMLAVMSFNVGVFLAAVAGHALGFFLARSRVHPAAAVARGGCAARERELGAVPPADASNKA